jgi:hypothetical protein
MSTRRHDLTLLRLSNINFRVGEEQDGSEEQFIIFGDSAYSRMSHLLSYYTPYMGTESLWDYFIKWNKGMKHVRISIEWNYMVTTSLFPYLHNISKLKILGNNRVSKIYIVCTILRNLYTMYGGSQSSKYFLLSMPKDIVKSYLRKKKVTW